MPITDEHKRLVYSAVVSGASDLYRMTVTIATTFLGGGLLYVEKFADINRLKLQPFSYPLILLGFGFLLLIFAIAASVWSQRLTLSAGNEVIDPNCRPDRVARLYRKATRRTIAANWFLILGMLLLFLFAYLNLVLIGD